MPFNSLRPGPGAFFSRLTGPVGVIGLLFLGSAVLRIATGAGSVWAADQPAPVAAPPAVTAHALPAPALCQTEADLQRLLDALLSREAAVESEEARITARLAELAETEARAKAAQAEAEVARAALEDTMALADSASETDLAQLTQMYERMKPKAAAAVFATMEPEFAAGFVGRMQPDAGAAVLAAMPPEAAYSVSVILAGRNAGAGHLPANH